jgi:hypothetical protein
VADDRITHVLYVSLDAVAADAVTRHSILGDSGRVRFLSAGTASWLLLRTETGTIAGGGQESLADVMTFGLENGVASFKSGDAWLESSDVGGDDPLNKLEGWAKGLIAVLAVALLLVGTLSLVAIRIAFG